ncbi:glycoside hydrolase family 3 protein [Streptomyces tanashiensis]
MACSANIVAPEQLAALTAQLGRAGRRPRRHRRGGRGRHPPGGQAGLVSFPGNYALGSVDDVELTRAVARELGRRLVQCGVDLNWAPSADVNSNARTRSSASVPSDRTLDLVARHTVAYVDGLQGVGVAACTKHFPGHGDTNVDSHDALPRIDVDLATLHARELVPFRAAVAAGTEAVMSAHILLSALDPHRPATLSPQILTGLLRQELGFEGLIVTDGMEMQAVAATYGIERGSVLAIAAGADAICVGGGLCDEDTVLRLRDALVTAVRTGELPEERLADAAARVRALAAWTQAHRARGAGSVPGAAVQEGTAPGADIGLVAARRALKVTRGRHAPHAGDPTSLRGLLRPGRELRGRRRDALGHRGRAGAAAARHGSRLIRRACRPDAVLAAAGERRIVAVVQGRPPAPVDDRGPGRPASRPARHGRGRDGPQRGGARRGPAASPRTARPGSAAARPQRPSSAPGA